VRWAQTRPMSLRRWAGRGRVGPGRGGGLQAAAGGARCGAADQVPLDALRGRPALKALGLGPLLDSVIVIAAMAGPGRKEPEVHIAFRVPAADLRRLLNQIERSDERDGYVPLSEGAAGPLPPSSLRGGCTGGGMGLATVPVRAEDRGHASLGGGPYLLVRAGQARAERLESRGRTLARERLEQIDPLPAVGRAACHAGQLVQRRVHTPAARLLLECGGLGDRVAVLTGLAAWSGLMQPPPPGRSWEDSP